MICPRRYETADNQLHIQRMDYMDLKERNTDREVTIAMWAFVIFFLLFIAVNKWILPAIGVRT